jgi:antitoxin YefM
MSVVTASTARATLYKLIDQVNEDSEPAVITGVRHNAVLIPESLYNAWVETNYLLSNPTNAARLREAMARVRAGQVTAHELDHDE